MLFTYDGVSVIIKRRAIRSSRNQTNRIGRKISVLLTIPSLTIQWKLDCRSHKPLDGVTGITVGCFFRFCMRRRQSCFRRVISIGVLPATPTPSPVKISLYRSSVTSRYDLWPSRSGFCDPEQKKHSKMESTFFHKLSTNRNVR